MIVYRLCRSKYSNDLSGIGAEKSGARWNSRGVPMVYTAASRALCTAEIAVHMPLGLIPSDYCMVSIEIPDYIPIVEIDALPYDWNSIPHSHSTQYIGDKFVTEAQSLVMKVPSVVVEGDFNYVINPKHADMDKIKIIGITPFNFDERLFIR